MADENTRSRDRRTLLAAAALLVVIAPPTTAALAAVPDVPAPDADAGLALPLLPVAAALLFRGRVRGEGAGVLLRSRVRRRLLALVDARPGATASALARELSVSHNNTLYHLRLLEDAGLVRVARRAGPRSFLRVYPAARAPDGLERAARLELTSDAARAVATRLLEAGDAGCSVPALVTLTGLPDSTVRYHLRRLERAGLVAAADAGAHLVFVLPSAARAPVGVALAVENQMARSRPVIPGRSRAASDGPRGAPPP